MQTTIRRVRRRTDASVAQAGNEIDFKKRKAIGELIELIELVVQHKREVAAATLALQDAEARLLAAMQDMKLVETKEGSYIATVERPAGRTSNTVDPKAFYELVSPDEFFSAVSVSVTEAKKVLPSKTLEKITTKVAGKSGEPRVKVEEVKVEAKLKKAR